MRNENLPSLLEPAREDMIKSLCKSWDSGWRAGLLVSSIFWCIILITIIYSTVG